jgi:tRNA pseudouridine38-40 synthase
VRHLLVAFSYDGGLFYGVSEQPKLRTVGGVLRACMERDAGRARVAWLARTDAGVHGGLNLASVWWRHGVPDVGRSAYEVQCDGMRRVVVVPADIKTCFARGLALNKRYVYRLHFGMSESQAKDYEARCGLVGRRGGAVCGDREGQRWQVAGTLDVQAMSDAMQVFAGTHDFDTFRAPVHITSNKVKTLARSELRLIGDDRVDLIIEGDSFLRQMVRMMVAAVVQVGRGQRTVDALRSDLAARDPRRGAWPAPPRGLTLQALQLPITPLGPEGWMSMSTLTLEEE